MTVQNSYPNEVWHALRTYWESTPRDVKWKDTCEFISDSLKHDVPSPQVVARKAAKEKWKKRSIIGRKKSTKTTPNSDKTGGSQVVAANQSATSQDVDRARAATTSATSDILQNLGGSQDDDFDSDDDPDLGTHPINIMPAIASSKSIEQNIKRIILRHRLRSAALGGMVDSILSNWTAAQELMAKEDMSEADGERIVKIMGFATGSTEMLKDLSAAHERLVKIDVGLWGIGPDDMKENQKQALTLEHEKLDRKMDEVTQAQKDQEREMLARMARIEAGELSFEAGVPNNDNDHLVSVGDDDDDGA